MQERKSVPAFGSHASVALEAEFGCRLSRHQVANELTVFTRGAVEAGTPSSSQPNVPRPVGRTLSAVRLTMLEP